MAHPIDNLMNITMDKIKEMVDVNTIVGTPITSADGTLIIPVSKVSYGFASGGSDLPTKNEKKDLFGGGSGAGVTIQPIAFLTVYGYLTSAPSVLDTVIKSILNNRLNGYLGDFILKELLGNLYLIA